jgi:hypothetical protein
MPSRILAVEHSPVVVAVRDVSAELPRSEVASYDERELPIERVYVHHSGALGADGLRGAMGSARYAVEQKGWAGIAYHYWVPFEAVYDDQGRPLVYQTQPHSACSWHTGGLANRHGLGVVLQGDLSKSGPSEHQRVCLPALLLALRDEVTTLDPSAPIAWHSISARWGGSGKPTCPGKPTEAWLREWLQSEDLPVPEAAQ